jgi:predicted nucleotidyltransferase
MEPLLAADRDAVLAIAERHGARNVRVFGSFARGEAIDTSDVDLRVSTTERTSPWLPAGLKNELEQLLGCPVHVVAENGLYLLLPRRVLREGKSL